jgi:hypothetical protein
MTEHEKLEREIHQLTQIIGANAFALAAKSTPSADRAGLRRQIEIRSARWADLLKQLSGPSSLGAAELRGPHAQAQGRARSEAHQGKFAGHPGSSADAHRRDQANAGEG